MAKRGRPKIHKGEEFDKISNTLKSKVSDRTIVNKTLLMQAVAVLKDDKDAVEFFCIGTGKLKRQSVLIELGRFMVPENINNAFKGLLNHLQKLDSPLSTHEIAAELRKRRLQYLETTKNLTNTESKPS